MCQHHEAGYNNAGTLVDRHDCFYVMERNRRIDSSFREARAEALREGHTGRAFDNAVTRHFIRIMNSSMNTPNWETEERKKAELRRPAILSLPPENLPLVEP